MRRLLVMTLIAALLAGCQPSPDGGMNSVLRRGNGGDPGSLDPALAQDIHAFNVLTDLYEGLVATDASGRIVPGVAESWRVSDDGLVWDFTLRSGAQWSNGDPVTAADFVRAFRRVAAADTPSAYGFLLESVQYFTDVKAGDRAPDELGIAAAGRLKLQIRLERPAVWFLSVLSMPIAYPMHESSVAPDSYVDVERFVGNGPYVLESAVIGGTIALRRNERYWDSATVAIERIEYLPIVDEVAELNMYRTGELDLTHVIPGTHLAALREDRPEEVRIAPMLALYYLAFDLSEPPFDAPEIREALSLAIDREDLVRIIGRGELAAYGVVPPGVANYTGPVYGWHAQSDGERGERARALLANAGYGPANPLSLTYTYDAGGIHERIALAIGAMWNESLGIEVEYDKREWQYFLQTRELRNEWQIMRFAWFGDYDDATTFLDIFRSDSPQNLPAYENSRYDAILDDVAGSLDAGRAGSLATAERMLLDDHAIVPLYFYVSKHMVSSTISGFEDNVLDRHPSRYLAFREQ